MQKGSDLLLMEGQAIMLHVGTAYVPVLRWGHPQCNQEVAINRLSCSMQTFLSIAEWQRRHKIESPEMARIASGGWVPTLLSDDNR